MSDRVLPFTIQSAFENSGQYDLFPEFIETLVMDEDIPQKLRKQIWLLVTICDDKKEQRCADVVAAFQDSEGPEHLAELWNAVACAYWADLPDCSAKAELS
jgi:hypothetical protein